MRGLGRVNLKHSPPCALLDTLDCAAMSENGVLHDRKTEAGASCLACAPSRYGRSGRKVRQVLLAYSVAVVAEFEEIESVVFAGECQLAYVPFEYAPAFLARFNIMPESRL